MTETANDLDTTDIARIRESFEALKPAIEDASTAFYAALFTRRPDYRALFREDIEGQGMRFMSAVRTIVDSIDRPDELSRHVGDLARGHAAFGIGAEHYAVMGDALMETFRAELGERFTPETEAAWRKAYGAVAAEMLAGAA